MMEFLKKFNEMTSKQMGYILPVTITVYEDRSYTFIVKQPLTSDLIKQAMKIKAGSTAPGTISAGRITRAQLQEVAEKKMDDLNTDDVEMAMRIVAGTARAMGIDSDL
jgi:large subunit ribosomal protein L11